MPVGPDNVLSAVTRSFPDSVWLADLDDTLIDTIGVHPGATAAMSAALDDALPASDVEPLVETFTRLYNVLFAGHQNHRNSAPEYKELLGRIDACQADISRQWGFTKMYSREVFLQLAAEDCDIPVRPEQIEQASQAYWSHVADHTTCFEDAIALSQQLSRLGLPLYIMTASDGRLTPTDSGQFRYDPELSKQRKAARIQRVRPLGVQYREVFIGDPVDKPTPEFFDGVRAGIEKDLGREVAPADVIVLGDSYRSDIEVPVSVQGAALGILRRRGQETTLAEQDRVVSVGDWQPVSALLSHL